jgi:hypothetical protein|uniref:Uncharacterized protein n=1 Tax=viral metagenome TaxID=1070528 RepID=A0A6C0CBQ7_9ZZZZ
MPIDPLYSDSPLLQGSKTDGCPKTATDVSYTSDLGYPVVTDIGDKKICTSEYFKTGEGDQYLYNTEGCCVLADSELNCTDVANVDAEEENNYYMGLRYFDVSDETSGERKICYTTPIRKKKLHIMDLLTKLLMEIIIFIVMVLVAACYEYWIIYGGCATGGIQTTLYESPYNVGNHDSKQSISQPRPPSNNVCPGDNTGATSSGHGLEWYNTFPYNLISFLNDNKGYNGQTKDTSNNFALSELVKIPARSLLLGFFYCIIFSRMVMKGLIRLVNYIGSFIYNKEPNKYSQFWSGLIFIFVFMGIYGAITDKYIVKLPYLNVSSLFLLSLIIIVTVWIPSLFSFFMMMMSFMGYRRESYTKYKEKRKKEIGETGESETGGSETSGSETFESKVELFYQKFDYYLLIEYFFMLKKNVTLDDENKNLCTNDNNSESKEKKSIFEINNEEDLDWFFPIRRSKIKWSCWSRDLQIKFTNLLNFNLFRTCKTEDEPNYKIGFPKKYYWYLSQFWDKPWHLFNPFFTLNVDCKAVEKANNLSSNWFAAAIFYGIASLFFPWIRANTFLISIAFYIAAMVIILLLSILWTCLIITIAMYSIFIALLGNILALFYLHFYVIIGFFYVPFKNYPELLKIIKSHGNILTLLFCIIVVLAGVNVLHPTSVGVIGGILGLLVLYKLITLLSV